jgi:hypothetical protein
LEIVIVQQMWQGVVTGNDHIEGAWNLVRETAHIGDADVEGNASRASFLPVALDGSGTEIARVHVVAQVGKADSLCANATSGIEDAMPPRAKTLLNNAIESLSLARHGRRPVGKEQIVVRGKPIVELPDIITHDGMICLCPSQIRVTLNQLQGDAIIAA